MVEIATHPEQVTPAWLTACLREAGHGGVQVKAVSWVPIGTGQIGDSARFTIEYAAPCEAPATLVGKFPAADEASLRTAIMMGLYTKEVGFYRDVAPHLAARLPKVTHADVNDDGSAFILLFEDLAPQRGGNQLEGCGIEDARHAIEQAAAIHAPTWHNSDILDLDWLQPREEVGQMVKAMYPQAQTVFKERYADVLEPEYMALCDALAASDEWLGRTHEKVGLVHGDFRLDNMVFGIGSGAEPIAILDWQTVTVGHPMTDIGYFLGSGIGDELRRAHESELLDLYCSEMTRRGVPLARADIWDDYLKGALHGVGTAVFSAAFVERTERGDANFLSMARGACALALQHDSLSKL